MSENTEPNGYLTIHLGRELKAKWLAWCGSRGLRPTVTLKEAIAEQLAEGELPAFEETPGQIDSGARTRFVLRLSPTEIDAVRARAEAEAVAPQLWVIRALRAQLTGRYQITDDAYQRAGELHQELKTIARNINQVARVLNREKAIPADEMEAILATHKGHLNELASLNDKFARVLSAYSVRFPIRRLDP
jgi:hypothetical protein